MKRIESKNRETLINALTNAQKLAFAPIAFQALATMLDLGIIEYLDRHPSSEKGLVNNLHLDTYTVRTLLQVAELNDIVKLEDNCYFLTKMGRLFLYDEKTIANFNFIKDVCYLGASELTNSFTERQPRGLHKFVGNYPTIYPALTDLPEKMRKSWYAFDHFYSRNCFDEVFEIISQKYDSIYDIGGNTGIFEDLCIKYNKNINITMLDLEENIEEVKDETNLKNCKFHPVNVLDEKPNYPKIENSGVLMSQFLDCFSKESIVKILTDIKNNMDNNSTIYILEPYTDKQIFEGARYALCHTSLYFTCMANGVSKFYTFDEMKELIEKSGLKITTCHDDLGTHNYTFLECRKHEMVSG